VSEPYEEKRDKNAATRIGEQLWVTKKVCQKSPLSDRVTTLSWCKAVVHPNPSEGNRRAKNLQRSKKMVESYPPVETASSGGDTSSLGMRDWRTDSA
jgi:hypothetical protein